MWRSAAVAGLLRIAAALARAQIWRVRFVPVVFGLRRPKWHGGQPSRRSPGKDATFMAAVPSSSTRDRETASGFPGATSRSRPDPRTRRTRQARPSGSRPLTRGFSTALLKGPPCSEKPRSR